MIESLVTKEKQNKTTMKMQLNKKLLYSAEIQITAFSFLFLCFVYVFLAFESIICSSAYRTEHSQTINLNSLCPRTMLLPLFKFVFNQLLTLFANLTTFVGRLGRTFVCRPLSSPTNFICDLVYWTAS